MFEVKPVSLPMESWNPGTKKFVRDEEMAKRVQALQSAEAALSKTKGGADAAALRLADAQLAVARADMEALKARIAADVSCG